MGLGNVLMGDDGFGPYVVGVLEASCDFPEGVELIDAGTPGPDLALYMEGRKAVIVVDTVSARGEAGELRVYRGESLSAFPGPVITSPHDPGLLEALRALAFTGQGPPDVLLIGAIPRRIGSGVGLSDPVRFSCLRPRALLRGTGTPAQRTLRPRVRGAYALDLD